MKLPFRRCDYQCNVPPDQQSRGTKRCKNKTRKMIEVEIGFWQHRCHIHRQQKYIAQYSK